MKDQHPKKIRPPAILLPLIAFCLLCVAARADTPLAAQAIRSRHAHFKELGRAMKSLTDQLRRSQPDWAVVLDRANAVAALSGALPRWFPAGSGPAHGVKTRARASIWSEPAQFARASQTLSSRAQDLLQAVASRDRASARARAAAVGHACGSCHRQFRAHFSWWW